MTSSISYKSLCNVVRYKPRASFTREVENVRRDVPFEEVLADEYFEGVLADEYFEAKFEQRRRLCKVVRCPRAEFEGHPGRERWRVVT